MTKISNNYLFFIISLILLFVLGCFSFLCSCSEEKRPVTGSVDSSLELIEEGTLNIGISPDYYPFENYDNNDIIGFDVDIANMLGKELGLKINFVPMKFDSIIDEVKSNKNIDIGLSAISITQDRQKVVTFTTPYYDDEKVFVAYAKSDKVNAFESLIKQPGVKVGVEKESAAQTYLSKNYVNSMQKEFENNFDVIDALIKGDIDYAFLHKSFIDNNSNTDIKIVNKISDKDQCAIAIPKGNENLYEALNKALALRLYDGTIASLLDKWFTKK